MDSLQRFGKKFHGGRNAHGLITAPAQGSLTKKVYRFVDFYRRSYPNVRAKVIQLLRDANRSAPLALIFYPFGCYSYILLTEAVKVGHSLRNMAQEYHKNVGDSLRLRDMPSGSIIHSLSATARSPGQYLRSAGVGAILVRSTRHNALLKLKSGEYKYFASASTAVFGTVAGGHHFLRDWAKAGTSRHFGWRPRVRAYAKNPVDHPMGGRTKGGTIRKTPKGRPCLATSTALRQSRFTIIKKRFLHFLTL